MAQMVHEAWDASGEKAMSKRFHKSYIDNPDFHSWWYTASGIPGNPPNNNPNESHQLDTKGSAWFHGMITLKKSYDQFLKAEFPKLIYTCSTERVGPERNFPVMHWDKFSQNHRFLNFWNELDYNLDVKKYKGGYLINDMHCLTTPITQDDINKYEKTLKGEFELGYESRNEFLNRARRFHHVTWEAHPTKVGVSYCSCTCRAYWIQLWCYQSVSIQHKEQLEKFGHRIKGIKKGKRFSQAQKESMLIKEAKRRKSQGNLPQQGTETSNNTNTGPAVLTQDHYEDDE